MKTFKLNGPPYKALSSVAEGTHLPILVCHSDGTWERCGWKRWGEIVHEHIEEIMSSPPRRSAFVP